MMLGTNRTELTNQLGREPGIFDMNEAQAKEQPKGFIDEKDIDEAFRTFQASRPQANPSEVFFTIASARGYCRDQTIMAEQRVKAGGRGKTYVYRLMWRQPVEGGRRVSQHSLDLPFMFDNVAAGANMTGPGHGADPRHGRQHGQQLDRLRPHRRSQQRQHPEVVALRPHAPQHHDVRRAQPGRLTIRTRPNANSWRAIPASRTAASPSTVRTMD